ncbi:hypothetical protein [Wolbachia endosymbiont of Ctenocephalides felis wCfeJ]|uniref:hypothetical protein n=1 Tax=Wolbachia endosymbiont of Ctenocephalides felis wCfeJ TaxID=2732594 RepID=UPI00144715D6|nr:hypothetical protein [Wolbachia endosymbiont of Ctenocephalides felis wCfeJ]WCR57780.1 MAG: hypothetical protein PG980_000252 [Wolbachia endosymbiont of Ctenocephalides felis wCfeJ]
MKIRLTLFSWMNIRELLFSILRKNENKAYLNGDRLLALWSRTLQSAGVTDGIYTCSLYDVIPVLLNNVIRVAGTGIHLFFTGFQRHSLK